MTTTKNGKKNTKRVAIVGATVAALMGGGIAFAAWTSTGSGSGSATAGTAQNLLVSTDGSATGLFPTGSQEVTVTVTNQNPYKVSVGSVSPGTTTVVKADGVTGTCTASVVSTVAKTSLSDVLAKAGSVGDSKTYTFDFAMSNLAEDECQGATFTIPFTATSLSAS